VQYTYTRRTKGDSVNYCEKNKGVRLRFIEYPTGQHQ